MPNAFQGLADDSYGPQYLHNVAVISTLASDAQRVASSIAAKKGDRSVGVAAAATGPIEGLAGDSSCTVEIDVCELDEIDADDFDIVIVIVRDSSAPDQAQVTSVESLDSAWTSKRICWQWDVEAVKIEHEIQELFSKIDDIAMRSACGAGTSC
mmetsp:Transcript_19754/g.37152  ORF Transcript_19754/g.37152 Transcript_19754/m.37152 type:complete len:154 (+) Transcript_19754:29-490(+)